MVLYEACYFPLFVCLARVAIHRLHIWPIVAAPTVWVGLELGRGYLFTGFSLALLGHTQVAWTSLIQISDIAGAYGVSFLLVLVTCCLAKMLPSRQHRWSIWPLAVIAGSLAAVLFYGNIRMKSQPLPNTKTRIVQVALIQGSFDTIFEYNPQRNQESFQKQVELTLEACRQRADLDLVIWPESMFTGNNPEILFEENGEIVLPKGGEISPADLINRIRLRAMIFQDKAFNMARWTNDSVGSTKQGKVHLLVGTETLQLGPHPQRRFNSALLINPDGKIIDRYYKMHRVIFGEYVPFGKLFPWLYQLTPMREGLAAGTRPQMFSVAGMNISPSICFESTVPHLIRSQIKQLRREGSAPDVLVNVTNDGWFWGSNCLDLHLTCSIFRAIENRIPMLIAANTGFSAWIDGNGKVIAKGPRRDTGIVFAEARPDGRFSLYQRIGDWPAVCCALFSMLLGLIGCRGKKMRGEPN